MDRNRIRRYWKAVLGIAASVMLCAGGILVNTYTVYAGSENEDPFAFRKGRVLSALQKKAKNYPDAFDLRNVDTDNDGAGDKSFVTSVKQQNPYGACWGFAAISAAESSLIADGLADENVDLSEKHVSYFAASYLDDPSNSQNGEGMHYRDLSKKDLATSAYKYDVGGTFINATSLFSSGIGPVSENAESSGILKYMGKNGEKIVRRAAVKFDEAGKPLEYARIPVWYSEDDDWSIPEKYRFMQSYRLKDSIMLPVPRIRDDSDVQTDNALMAIKQQMFENHRAVSIGFSAETYLPGQDTSGKKYMSGKWAHYTDNGYEIADHLVTIVGWDDHYPKENFLTPPPSDGAFLIKNSWGSDLNEFPQNGGRHWGLLEGCDRIPYLDAQGKEPQPVVSDPAIGARATGYFWLSYCDKSLSDPETFVFEKATDANNYEIAQMDFMQSGSIGKYSAENCRSANVFTAEKTSELKEISFVTTVPGTNVSYKVYALPEDFDDPESGVKIAEGKTTCEYGGYHRISINCSMTFARDQKYSVVISESAGSDSYVPFTSYYDRGLSGYSVVVLNERESYCYIDGEWKDITNKNVQGKMAFGDEMDNFPIKAFLKPTSFSGYLAVSNWQEGTPGSYDLLNEQEKTLTAEFRGFSNSQVPTNWNPTVNWRSGDDSVAVVTPKDSSGEQAVIKGVSAGKAYIIVDAGEYGSRLIGVKVKQRMIDWASLKEDEFVYTGQPIEPELSLVSVDVDDYEEYVKPAEGIDYTVDYKNNVKAGTGSVILSGIGKYAGTYEVNFTILPSKAEIKSLTAGEEKLSVSMNADPSACGAASYQIRYREKDSSDWKTAECTTASAAIENLKPDTEYEVQVRAFTKTDKEELPGEWSDAKISEKISKAADSGSESETDQKESDTGQKESETDQKESEGDRKETETEQKESETDQKESETEQKGSDGTEVGPGASAANAEKAIMNMESDKDLPGTVFAKLRLRSTKQTKTSITLIWRNLVNASTYVIYGNKCGKARKPQKLAEVSANKKTIKMIGDQKLKKGIYYKFIVVALDKDHKVISTSKLIHAATRGGKVGNRRKVTVKKSVIKKAKKLKKGKSLKLTAKAIAQSKKRKVKKHVSIRYESSSTSIASVSKKGVVKAQNKGTCYIFAYAQNGVYKKIKVKVVK